MSAPGGEVDRVTHRPHPGAFWLSRAAVPLAVLAAFLPPEVAPLPHLALFAALALLNIVLTMAVMATGEPDIFARLFPEPASGRAWETRAQIGERVGGPGSPMRGARLRALSLAFALLAGGAVLAVLLLEGDALGRALLLLLAAVEVWHADAKRRLADLAARRNPRIAALVS